MCADITTENLSLQGKAEQHDSLERMNKSYEQEMQSLESQLLASVKSIEAMEKTLDENMAQMKENNDMMQHF